ncbi:uncharacterized protein LOC110717383 isoform X1 [Chenopodium quinoa]|uniref:uncharacterized protein LOC110717383 isoform X1 n=1 Tax=Chenopodium quinoa TaxID=63459 RepID=UPI000B77DC08|nr:uncharacterized protein LOC110717383 isoform X1 [Chenopodium quinoa]
MIDKITAHWKENVNVADFIRSFELRKTYLDRVTVYKRSSTDPPPIIGYEITDRGWKSRDFFALKDSLGESARWMRSGWHTGLRLDAIKPEDGSQEEVEALYRFLIVDRTFSGVTVPPSAASTSMASGRLIRVVYRIKLNIYFPNLTFKIINNY